MTARQEIIPPDKALDVTLQEEVEIGQRAALIRELGTNMIESIFKIGEHLHFVKEKLAHGRWAQWLDEEFKWSDTTAQRFMRAYDLRGKLAKPANSPDLNLPLHGVFLLTQRSTPQDARDAVMKKAANGGVSLAEVKKMIADAKKEADQELKETIAAHKAELKKLEDEVRDEFGDHIAPKELKAKIEAATKPVLQKLETAQKALAEKHTKERSAAETSKIRREVIVFDEMLHQLADCLAVDHREVLKADLANEKAAERVHKWLSKYLDLVEEAKGVGNGKAKPRRTAKK